MATETNIESTLTERRLFAPPPEFTRHAAVKTMAEYETLYKESLDSPDTFWPRMASELHWFKKWDKLLDWSNPPFAKWFVGGKINISYNCLDRHLTTHRKNKAAIIFEGEPGDRVVLTYAQLHREVCKFANVLKSHGVQSGDRVAIYMPMIPEAAVAMLACMRIGAGHTIVFGGFSAEALADRINDAQASLVITADGGWRRGKIIDLKKNVDAALAKTTSVRHCVVVKRTGHEIAMHPKRDLWYHEQMATASADCPAEELDSEHLCFILYTSGTTGKPKGVMHTTGGYLLGAYLTCKYVFDLKDTDVYWCTADIGWVTGHSYVVYGPLANGATTLMYEGAPNSPKEDRFWETIENYGVNVFYTAPTAIRAFIKWGDEHPKKHDLSSLRLLGTVGEPINPEAWMWYREIIGGDRCPIVDTWWQTETGMIMITPLPGVTATKPGTATLPFFGVDAAIVDRTGKELGPNQGGLLVIRKPWPSMLRGIFNDPDRYKRQYWSDVPGMYFTGDGARRDNDGYFWIMGRIDDVLNVSGHRLGTAEVESAIVSHESVAEAAVVGMPHELKGQGIAAFVTLRSGCKPSDDLKKELVNVVRKQIGALATPDQIRFTDSLPKTRSGKIMRRLLKELAGSGDVKGDVTTLEDFTVIAKLKEQDEG
ncbi:MAG TPA: acetate--CoA ligase [Phycisphaerae bacterium]|nr:acetate--CoA ligase [Phycisphaerae bacterium]